MKTINTTSNTHFCTACDGVVDREYDRFLAADFPWFCCVCCENKLDSEVTTTTPQSRGMGAHALLTKSRHAAGRTLHDITGDLQ